MDKTFFIIAAIVIAIINVVKILVPLFGQMGTTTGATGSKEWWQTAGFDYANQQLIDQQNQQLIDQQNQFMDQQNRFMDQQNQMMQQQFVDQHNMWAMQESQNMVTPFEAGGYNLNMGNSFNDFGGGFGGGCGMF